MWKRVSLPATLRRIGKSAFIGCEKLAEVCLPEGVEELDESAFQDCTNILRFFLPASLQRIGYLALHVGDGRLLSVEVAKGNKYFTSKYGVLYNHNMTVILSVSLCQAQKRTCETVAQVFDALSSRSEVIDSLCWVPEGAGLIK